MLGVSAVSVHRALHSLETGTRCTLFRLEGRNLLWVPKTRNLFVTQCTPLDAIQHFRVGQDHTVTALPASSRTRPTE